MLRIARGLRRGHAATLSGLVAVLFLGVGLMMASPGVLASESRLITTLQALKCTDEIEPVRLLADQVQHLPLSKAGLPVESGDTRAYSYLSAGTLDLLLSTLLDKADRFPELVPQIQQTVLQWNYCSMVNIKGASDIRATSESVIALQATYLSPDQWSGFRRVSRLLINARSKRLSAKTNYYSDSLQCLLDFSTRSANSLDRRLRGGPTRVRAGQVALVSQWSPNLQSCRPDTVEIVESELRESDKEPVPELPAVAKTPERSVAQEQSGSAEAVDTAENSAMSAADSATAVVRSHAIDVHGIPFSSEDDKMRVSTMLLATDSVPGPVYQKVEPSLVSNEPLLPDVAVGLQQQLVSVDSVLDNKSTGSGSDLTGLPPTPVSDGDRAQARFPETDNSSSEPEVYFVETVFVESTVVEIQASIDGEGRYPDVIDLASDTKDVVYSGSAFQGFGSYASLALSRLSGTVQLSTRVGDGSSSIGADLTFKPMIDSYWFARIGASTIAGSDQQGYRWGLGYDDWHAGTWFLMLNNWGPINGGNGLDLENAVLTAGYKFRSPLLERFNITGSASLNATAAGTTEDRVKQFAENASANLTLQWSPINNWFVRASFDRKLEGGPVRWSYVFGRYNWRANQLNFEYANYSQSRIFEPNFAGGTIGISYNLKF